MSDKVPGVVKALAKATRAIVGLLRRVVADEAQFHALQAELGLPRTAYDKDQVRAVNDRLVEVDAKLAEGGDRDEDDFSADAEIIDLILRGKALERVIESLFAGDRFNGDVRTAADIAAELFGILASEWMRVHVPLLWAALRLVMFGYERVEELPRFDPFVIFDRLSGNRTKTKPDALRSADLVAGIGIPALVIAVNALIDRFSETQPEAFARYPDGKTYYAADIKFDLGWEPDSETDPQVLELLVRSLSLLIAGKQKKKGSDTETDIALALTVTQFDDPVEGAGVLIRLGGNLAVTIDLAPQGDIKHALNFALTGGPGLNLLWTESGLKSEGVAVSPVLIEAKFAATGTEDIPAFRYGKAGKSRLDIQGYGASGSVSQEDQFLGLTVKGGRLVLMLDELLPGGLGVLFKALAADKFEAKVDGTLKASARSGLSFDGEAGLKLRLASGVSIGPARVDYLDLGFGAKDGALRLDAEAAGRFSIGAFTASMERFGVSFAPTTGDFAFLPPKGIGLKIDAVAVKGGGYLAIDVDAHQFAGALELTIGPFSVKAIAILSTGGPGAKAKFALFVLLYMRWPGGLELGMRFTLNAIGGMLGVNHDFDVKALMDALPSGAMDDVLFPDDPVGDAPRIIAALKTIFPVKQDSYVIGVMAEIGWGSDYFCSLRLGVILPFGKEAGPDDGFFYIHVLGRLQIKCFKFVPKALRLEITCDFVGQFGFGRNGISICIYARLRDSHFGPTSIEGALAFSVRTGPNARFLVAAGGFHPGFKQIPEDLPSPIDRIGTSYDIGVMKTWLKGYFAVASGTIQFGVILGVRYSLGPIAFTAELGFDALIHLSPFSFEAEVRASAALTYRGQELLGIHLRLTIWGPGRWRVKGHGSFSILFWDVDVDVDESWGDELPVEQQHIALEGRVRDDLKDASNWTFSLPGDGAALVTVHHAGLPADPAVALVHPLSGMSYAQRRIPFGLQLERLSFCVIDGISKFPVPKITTLGGAAVPGVAVVFDQFAVPEYLNLTDDQKFSRPGFESLPAGVSVGTGGYAVPEGRVTDTVVECELIFSAAAAGPRDKGLVALERLGLSRLAGFEAAGTSAMKPLQSFLPGIGPVRSNLPLWAAADAQSLTAVAGAVPSWAAHSAAATATFLSRGINVVEAYELAGAP